MSFSIVIPSRNVSNLEACVKAIRAAGETARVIVVWDGRDLDKPGVPNAYVPAEVPNWPSVDVWYAPDCPWSFAGAVNVGIRHAPFEDVILLNDDAVLVRPFGFTAMERAANANPDIGVVSAAIEEDPRPQLRPRPLNVSCEDTLSVPRLATERKMLPFICVYLRRAVIDQVGLLDERFTGTVDIDGGICGVNPLAVYGGEDDDYCYRVRSAGMHLGVYQGCVVNHSCLPSTFRPGNVSRSIAGTRARFREIHGFEMGTK